MSICKYFRFHDEGKHLIWKRRAASVPVHPKPMVEGGGVFGEGDGNRCYDG